MLGNSKRHAGFATVRVHADSEKHLTAPKAMLMGGRLSESEKSLLWRPRAWHPQGLQPVRGYKCSSASVDRI